jgi:5-methylcytosine-specific restriction endonuclease McrA
LSNKPRLDAQRFISKKIIKELIFELHGKICLCCGSLNNIALDHIVPVFLNGKNENLQPLCNKCNSKKGISIIDYRKEVKWISYNGLNSVLRIGYG